MAATGSSGEFSRFFSRQIKVLSDRFTAQVASLYRAGKKIDRARVVNVKLFGSDGSRLVRRHGFNLNRDFRQNVGTVKRTLRVEGPMLQMRSMPMATIELVGGNEDNFDGPGTVDYKDHMCVGALAGATSAQALYEVLEGDETIDDLFLDVLSDGIPLMVWDNHMSQDFHTSP